MCRTFKSWFRQFVAWEAIVHVFVSAVIIMMFAERLDVTEARAIAGIAAYSASGATCAYLVFKHCLKHPRRLFKKIDRWMRIFFVAEYFGYIIGVAAILWATASTFDKSELQSIGFIAVANAIMVRWSWKIYKEDKHDYRKIGASDA